MRACAHAASRPTLIFRMSLKQQAVRGSFSMLSGQLLKFALNLGSITVLARLLSPDDYGLVAIALSTTVILETFREAGLSTATLQRPTLSQIELSSMHWVNVGLGFAVFLFVLGLAPVMRSIYDREQLLYILPCFGAVGLVASFGVQRAALLQRNLEFRKLAIADVSSQAAGLVAGIAAALQGAGYWALVISQGTTAIGYNLALAVASDWRADLVVDREKIRPLLSFGASIMASRVLNRMARGLDALVIGYFLNTAAVGIYNRAQSILNRPLDQLASPVLKVALSVMYRLSDDARRFSDGVMAMLGLISLGSSILVLFFLNFAGPIVLVMLGDNWSASVPIFIALTPFAFVEPSACFLSDVLVAKGDSRALLKWTVVSVVIIGLGLLVGLQWGLVGVATSFGLFGLFVRMPLFMLYTCRTTGLSFPTMARFILPSLAAGAAGAVLPIYHQVSGQELSLPESCIQASVSFIAFAAVYLSFRQGRKMVELINWIVRNRSGGTSFAEIIAR